MVHLLCLCLHGCPPRPHGPSDPPTARGRGSKPLPGTHAAAGMRTQPRCMHPTTLHAPNHAACRRMEEVRANEVRATLEDLMYVSILEKFVLLGVEMLPRMDGGFLAADGWCMLVGAWVGAGAPGSGLGAPAIRGPWAVGCGHLSVVGLRRRRFCRHGSWDLSLLVCHMLL